MFNFSIDINSGYSDFKYISTAKIIEWTSTKIVAKVNFTFPLTLSSGYTPDRIEILDFNRSMFVSNETGLKLDMDQPILVHRIPKQMPPGVEEDSVKA